MKKILLQLDGDRTASVFDAVTAYDAGADILLQYGGVAVAEVRAFVYGAMFTRGPSDLKSSAIFVGGTDVAKGEAMLKEVCGSFFGPLRTSVMLDANGCNTTATAAVVKIVSTVPVAGAKVVVLAGTGPVGQRAAALFAKEGAEVVLTSADAGPGGGRLRGDRRAFRRAASTPAAAADEAATRSVLEGAAAVLCTGVTGVTLIPEAMWRGHSTLRVLGDVNAVPPLGLEATKATWDGKDVDGKIVFGALGDRRSQDEGAPSFHRAALRAERPGAGRGGDLRARQGAGRVVRILVLGVSTRAMVESAVRGGHDVVAVDFFGDRDQARMRGELRAAARSRPAGDRRGIGGGGAASRRRRGRLRLEPGEPPRGGRRR